jgi:hypothetical protein
MGAAAADADRRTRHGKRDQALLHLLGSAGLRRAEVATSWSPTSTSAPRRRSPPASGGRPIDELVGHRSATASAAAPAPCRSTRTARGHRRLRQGPAACA